MVRAHVAGLFAVVAGILGVLAISHSAPARIVPLRPVVVAGDPAPGGGRFEHFSIEQLPIVAPINTKGHVAFFATLLRGPASEGIFLAAGGRISRIAME